MAERYPVVVLAAGSSRRMGRPKALLDFGGRTCMDLVMDACRGAGQGPIVVVLGSGSGAILARLGRSPEIQVVVNPEPSRGQTSSVKAGLRALGGAEKGIFLMPVDHPLIEAGDFEALAKGFSRRPRGKTMRIPAHGGRRGHPLLLAGEHRMPLLGMDDVVPLHAFVRARAREVDIVERPGPGVITGINTEADYRRALELHWKMTSSHRAGSAETRRA